MALQLPNVGDIVCNKSLNSEWCGWLEPAIKVAEVIGL